MEDQQVADVKRRKMRISLTGIVGEERRQMIEDLCSQMTYEDVIQLRDFVESRFKIDFCSGEHALPQEVVAHIFSFLTYEELEMVGQVSKLWRETSLEGIIWKQVCFNKYPHIFRGSRLRFVDRLLSNDWRKNFSALKSHLAPLSEIARTYFSSVITSEGDVYMWGAVTDRVTLKDVEGSEPSPSKFPNDEKILSLSCGQIHYIAIAESGRLITCGCGRHGRLGVGNEDDLVKPVLLEGPSKPFVNVSAGVAHTGAITIDGELYMWGCGGKGRLGNGCIDNELVPRLLNYRKQGEEVRFMQVSCGAYHTLALSTKKEVFSFGYGANGRLGLDSEDDMHEPGHIEHLSMPISFVSSGWEHSCAITEEGKLYAWGVGEFGQLGRGSLEDAFRPYIVPFEDNVKIAVVSAGGWFTAAIDEKGLVYTWGRGVNGQLGHGDRLNRLTPTLIKSLHDEGVVAITVSAAGTHALVVDVNGAVYTFGMGRRGQLGQGSFSELESPTVIRTLSHVRAAGVYVKKITSEF